MNGQLPDFSQSNLGDDYAKFKKKYRTQKILRHTKTDLHVYFCDWLLFAKPRGFSHNDYFDYELYNKELDVRETFLNEGFRQRVFKACCNMQERFVFKDKAKFNTRFKKWVQRDWVDSTACTLEQFSEFLSLHPKFFGKPVRGTGGAGASVYNSSAWMTEELFNECKAKELICEEIVEQHPSLARFNASTLNTVRVTTLLCSDGVPRIVLTVARFGRAGKCVDNFHGGGVGAVVDIDSGKIITEAINRSHQRSPYHPDSKLPILGFTFPEWEKVKQAVCEAASTMPEVRNIGWDVSVTKDGDIEFIEGNCMPNYDVLQSPDQKGRRFRYEPYLEEIEKAKGIIPERLPEINIVFEGELKRKTLRNIRKAGGRVKRALRGK